MVESATKFIGGHGTTLGGVIVEGGGNFNWAAVPGKFPTLTEPDPSYHGLNFYEALAEPVPFVTRIRAVACRATPVPPSPRSPAFLLLQGTETLSLRVERHVQNALKVDRVPAEPCPRSSPISRPSDRGAPLTTTCTRSTSRTVPAPSSPSTFEGGKDAARVFIDNLHPVLAAGQRGRREVAWSSTRPPPRTPRRR